MIKFVNFENVNFNEKFSYKGRTYKKVVCANDEPGAFNLFDETICTSCQNWSCLVDRKEDCVIEPPKERKNFVLSGMFGKESFGISLTTEQIDLLNWLDEKGLLHEDIMLYELKVNTFTEI